MASPVNLSDLPVATSAANNDLMLIRKGLTDYQIAVQAIRQINIAALDPIPGGTPVQTDLLMISRTIGGTPQNFRVQFAQVGFPKNTRMWFYNALPPAPNWSVVANTGGNLLAAQDFSKTYAGNVTAGNTAGTWQQDNAFLSIEQIPAHSHQFLIYTSDEKGNLSTNKVSSTNRSTNNTFNTNQTGGVGSTNQKSANPAGAVQGHNHGNTWRPLANVGVIGNKDY
jgi:hypothetical protein